MDALIWEFVAMCVNIMMYQQNDYNMLSFCTFLLVFCVFRLLRMSHSIFIFMHFS